MKEKRLVMYHHRAGWLCSPQKVIEVMEKAVQYSWINNQWEVLEEIFSKDKTSSSSSLNLKRTKRNILKVFDKYSLVESKVVKDFMKAKSMGRLEEKGISSLADYGIDCNEANEEYINKYSNLLHEKIMSKFGKLFSSIETFH